jgi:hypothetical protein
MWSLPDINQLNAIAAAERPKLEREMRRKRHRPNCEVYPCAERSAGSEPYFDIFSDDPKGLVHTCSEHSAVDLDGYFYCEHCERLMVENYTWERYRVELDGMTLCLKCAAEIYFCDEQNWIEPRLVKSVVLRPRQGRLFDAVSGVLNIAQCRHVLAVKQPTPEVVVFHDNFEFDSMDGHQISGERMLDVIRQLDQPFCPAMDAAYQFAVSIGIYLKKSSIE